MPGVGRVLQAVGAAARVETWGYNWATHKDDLLGAAGTRPTTDPIAQTAYDNAAKVLDYYRNTYGRNSYDNRGATLKIRVHAPDADTGKPNANNAYWFNDEGRIWLGDGDGVNFTPLGNGADVLAHEFTHAVIDSEVNLDTWGQNGGLHESFSDVMASGVDGNWQIGEGVYTPKTPGDSLRDLKNPRWHRLQDMTPGESEVHNLAEVPNYAAYKVAEVIGGNTMRKIWYLAITDHFKGNSGFTGARQATIAAAEVLYGKTSKESAAVRDAWTAVGITDHTPPSFWSPADAKFDIANTPHVDVRGAYK
jgi:bacillolysin/thermolysin